MTGGLLEEEYRTYADRAIDLLDPLRTASSALNALDSHGAWDELEARLRRCGLERSALFSVPLGKGQFPQPQETFGTSISREFEAYAHANPSMVDHVPGLRRLVNGDWIVPVIPGTEEFATFTPDEIEYYETMRRFGFRGGFATSFPHRQDRSIFIFTSSSLVSREVALAAYTHVAPLAVAAVAAFIEALDIRNLLADENFVPLSRRERECLGWVASGRTTQQIAERLRLTNRTVDEYVSKAIVKLRATNRAHACTRAMLISVQQKGLGTNY